MGVRLQNDRQEASQTLLILHGQPYWNIFVFRQILKTSQERLIRNVLGIILGRAEVEQPT